MPKVKIKGTRAQHAALDAKFRKILRGIPVRGFMSIYVRIAVMEVWGAEKVYLSIYGRSR